MVAKICSELSIHAKVEAALKDSELILEATVEYATLKSLIAQVEDKEPSCEIFDAKITVLSEYIKHHMKEKEG